MSAWMPAPPPGIRSGDDQHPCRAFIPPAWAGSGRYRCCAARIVSQISSTTLGEQLLILALGHDADDRLGSRICGSPAARRCRAGLSPSAIASLDRGAIRAARPSPKRTLRNSCGTGSNSRHTSLARSPGLDDRGQHLERRDQAVAGRRIVAEDDMTGLLAAEIAAEGAHLFDDVAVADRGAVQPDPLRRRDSVRGRDWT